ncbi:hypothetical protein ENBRE01_1523 [Enteropsectra breve]|nr:hypothetical protein ENBRE01_1523 [Enteropsectra breve]
MSLYKTQINKVIQQISSSDAISYNSVSCCLFLSYKRKNNKRNMLLFLGAAMAYASECPALTDGLVITKYYLDGCGACEKIQGEYNALKEQMIKANISINYREVECTTCDCTGVTSFPTIEITEDQKAVDKIVGYKALPFLAEWVTKTLKLKEAVLKTGIEHSAGKVTPLIPRDFLSGFEGQWLILFYENKSEEYRKIFLTLAKEFENTISFGEASKASAEHVTNRFAIPEYPHVVAINNGTIVPFGGKGNREGLRNFVLKLAAPSFTEITLEKLRKEASKLAMTGEPIFVVIYKNFEIASHYFNSLAQQFKFKAKIYRSSDDAIFSASGFYPKESHDDHNKMTKLFVYKNGIFYPSPARLEDGDDIIQWIFHSHFAHVTNINNENFYTIFHGMKPVLILLTSGEKYLEEYNRLSAERHMGSPYADIVFAVLDVAEYPIFKEQVLPTVDAPSLAFYDPIKVQWYHEKTKLSGENFKNETEKVIDRYFRKKLSEYPAKKSKKLYYILGAWAVGMAAYLALKINSDRQKVE